MFAEIITTGGIFLQFLTGTTGEIVMQLILGCNSKTTVMFLNIYQQNIYFYWVYWVKILYKILTISLNFIMIDNE
jgi:hypothetical protein